MKDFSKIFIAVALSVALVAAGLFANIFSVDLSYSSSTLRPYWREIPGFSFKGGLKAFWNVGDRTNGENLSKATSRGFSPLTLIDTYNDTSGGQRKNISNFAKSNGSNPWQKPPYFEAIIRRNITDRKSSGIYVNDIEIPFEQDAAKAWADPAIRAKSGAKNLQEFDDAYYREWASWFYLPLKWTKEIYPGTKTGLYGVQPFRRDYWGIAGKTAQQIDGTHVNDARLWQQIDPYADFYIASIYVFYDSPDSIFYMAANVEENYQRTRRFGNKPVYTYTWMRFHDANKFIVPKGRELTDYLVEAMAIVPYFSGAQGIVLWGNEPHLEQDNSQPYYQLPLFVKSLQRVAALSDKLGNAKLFIDEPAYVLWKEKRPLIRRFVIRNGECILMALNPWQGNGEESKEHVQCGDKSYFLTLRERHATIVHVDENSFSEY